MKTLYIVRHAKSSWEDPLLDDFARPLNDRGKRDAPKMAKRMKEKSILPDLMMTSPARRAKSTCKRMAEIFKYDEEKIRTERELYLASSQQILNTIRGVKDKHQSLLIVGHNPGLTEFVNALAAQTFANIPTCGVAAFEIVTDSWKDLKPGMGKLLFYDFPRDKKKKEE